MAKYYFEVHFVWHRWRTCQRFPTEEPRPGQEIRCSSVTVSLLETREKEDRFLKVRAHSMLAACSEAPAKQRASRSICWQASSAFNRGLKSTHSWTWENIDASCRSAVHSPARTRSSRERG